MKLIKLPASQAAAVLAKHLTNALQSHSQVTWLVPGGSNIAISAQAMQLIPEKLSQKLIIVQTDERYGQYDHPDSNWLQLKQAGFNPKQARIELALMTDNLSLAETVGHYNSQLLQILNNTYTIGQFGMGADGHIAGILPNSSAVDVDDKLVCGYRAELFTRISLSLTAIAQISEAYTFVYGRSKHEALANLADKHLTLAEQPAQILKNIEQSLVYNDQFESEDK